MTEAVRPTGYTGTMQRLVITESSAGTITVHLWGAGGGSGGNDSNRGGNGSGGIYAQKTLTVQGGDVIDVAVGQYGGGGGSYRGGAPGGSAGASYTGFIFDSLTAKPQSGATIYPVTNGAWCSFLNQHGVWDSPGGGTLLFDQTYTITVQQTGNYEIIASCDDYGEVYIDGVLQVSPAGYTQTYSSTIAGLSAGQHTVRLVGHNSGGPSGIGVTIGPVDVNVGYSGAIGGNAGGAGGSGGGGGGGGATILWKNGVVVAVAGGGGGGGGGGNRGAARGQNAPGSQGRASPGTNNGQNGRSNQSDGGGGGGGGGGYGGGNGGLPVDFDQGGLAGSTGGGLGDLVIEPSGTLPGNYASAYRFGNAGIGGTTGTYGVPGSSGQATVVFDIAGALIKDGSTWKPVTQIYIKADDTWNAVKEVYIKDNGAWKLIQGTDATAPTFAGYGSNLIGVNSRTNLPPPPPPPDDGGYSG